MFYEKDLEIILQNIMRLWDIPGLAVGIVEGGKIAYTKGFGVQNLNTQVPVTQESVFCVQSVSKCFVATAIMQMVEGGQLSLDMPIVQYLPYFQLDDERSCQITIRQMLSHTSGMPDMEDIEYVEMVTHPEDDDGAAERFVRGLSNRKLIANPGERFRYSNIAYNVLGDLLAKASADTFEGVMKANVLDPSGMRNSTFLLKNVPEKQLAWPHLRSPEMKVNPVYPYHRADAPASSLHTTVLDMCQWAITSLNRGCHLDQQLLSPAGYDLMWTKVTERGGQRPGLYEDMGLGWTLGHINGEKTVSHGGGGFGGTAFLLLLPEKDCAVVVLCNEESFAHFRVLHAVVDTLLGHPPRTDTVSWMVPISRALAEGGIDAANACYSEIKGSPEFDFDQGDLLDLSLQLLTANQLGMVVDVLNLNIQIFPGYIGSYLQLAKLYVHMGESMRAKGILLKALSIDPDNRSITHLLKAVESPEAVDT